MGVKEGAGSLDWSSVRIRGRRVRYGEGGDGPPMVFLHGWALGSRAYKRGLTLVAQAGSRVYAPALPGFGGSDGLAGGGNEPAAYGEWLEEFLDAVGVRERVIVAGHSLGGAVATDFAARVPDRIAHLVLVNSIGAPVFDRPVYEWVADFSRDLFTTTALYPTLRSILDDAVANVVANPAGLLRLGIMALKADLRAELETIAGEGVPVTAVSSLGDLVVPPASFELLCQAAGVPGRWVPGRHSWLLGDPDGFAEIMADVLGSVRAATAAELPLAANE